ncbi:MAG: 3-deoxy-manno-octulosonate cytidylyltransferase [Candidatus Obscuribacterales bacterium]|nr:3-deoxy-manno-octulosonate cytidylyltransferase [Candidatus Obscuribacterales bacterium]
MSKKKIAVVIPARYASTRFPGKPLVDIAGKTMIERVYAQAMKAKLVSDVLVATDDQRIYDAVKAFGGQVRMTRNDHPSGTDRLAEIATAHPELEIIVNVQGDEPLIDPSTIDAAVLPLVEDERTEMSTIAARIREKEEICNNTVVKVVRDACGNALYFSRLPIPYYRESDDNDGQAHYAHIGLYVYRRDVLLKLASLPPTPLEKAEALEQLRALENGINIRVVEVEKRSPAVDRPEDLKTVIKALEEAQTFVAPPVPGNSTIQLR